MDHRVLLALILIVDCVAAMLFAGVLALALMLAFRRTGRLAPYLGLLAAPFAATYYDVLETASTFLYDDGLTPWSNMLKAQATITLGILLAIIFLAPFTHRRLPQLYVD